ncbi:YihY/virulence factor BrkB family protein [Leucobacter sp. HY1910]
MKQPGNENILQRAVAAALRHRIVRSFLLYSEKRGSELADSITYRALFSVFAGVLLTFSLAALWLGSDHDALKAVERALNTVIPGLADIVDMEQATAPIEFTIVGIISLLGLVGAGISAIASLRTALGVLDDRIHDEGNFVWVLLRNLFVGIGFAGLVGAAAVLSIGADEIVAWLLPAMQIDEGSFMARAITRVASVIVVLVIDAVAVALVFRVLSGIRPRQRDLWKGAVLGAVGLTVLQQLSSLFVSGATSNPLLASFAALIALLLWLNLSAQVILIASCYIFTATTEAHDKTGLEQGAHTLAQRRLKRAEDMMRVSIEELEAAQKAEADEASRAEKKAERAAQKAAR